MHKSKEPLTENQITDAKQLCELERMSREEAERMVSLSHKLLAVIEDENDYTYQDVMHAIDAIKSNYEKKGHDLLNSMSIQEVSKFGALLK